MRKSAQNTKINCTVYKTTVYNAATPTSQFIYEEVGVAAILVVSEIPLFLSPSVSESDDEDVSSSTLFFLSKSGGLQMI